MNIDLNLNSITIGAVIRAWDFEKIEGRQDCFVEGIVTEIAEDHYVMHVLKDTVHPVGARLEVHAPKEDRLMLDFDNRIEMVAASAL